MNKYKYKIVNIYHSGRKGVRWSVPEDPKYDDLVGCLCTFDPFEVKQFESIRLWIKNHPIYRWWDTSAIIQLSCDFDGKYYLETINTIYVFEEVKE